MKTIIYSKNNPTSVKKVADMKSRHPRFTFLELAETNAIEAAKADGKTRIVELDATPKESTKVVVEKEAPKPKAKAKPKAKKKPAAKPKAKKKKAAPKKKAAAKKPKAKAKAKKKK